MAIEADCFPIATEPSEDPRQLLRRFLWLGLLCVALLLALATYGVYRVYSWRLVESAHAEAQAICQVVLVKEKRQLLDIDNDGNVRLVVAEDHRADFNRRMRQYLKPYAVDAVRIWDRQLRLVNSSGKEQSDHGQAKSPLLAKALAGQSFSRLEKNGSVYAAESKPEGAHGQMVSYLPIWGRHKTVLGAIEIRRNMEEISAQLLRAVTFSGIVLAALLSALFSCIYLLVRKGAVRLAKAQEDLRWLATTDPLTGVYNRREVLARTEELLSQWRAGGDRNASFVSVLMVDFDNFKIINDTYGHPVGDRVLQELAARIQSCLEPKDILGRMGGEEFLVVLPGVGVSACREIAERLCQAVCGTPFDPENYRISGSISVGMATMRAHGGSVDAMLHDADQGLYVAKNSGKNCASLAAELPSDPDFSGKWVD
ncbi:diguanylate cyclase [Syntrophotalea carbinolica DSM 2380]|uniref:diguanylate cyclase n=1 Tax=Syntrophotalea carbinolica (strain DSM 2380 / NBRC 103641 / GraBd1) TaxID=338963 RepID=Q3A771_SYNC1|nr:GGDEF domain-containing protein [Syntrophotalea carbinolica]ABA87773.1 diguanylate cyclase [Syntrophotalea carbinolica DSM 2380]